MYIFKLIGLTCVNLLQEARRLPRGILEAIRERRLQAKRVQFEAERLDRIRQPWKYEGRP
jgi:hypothetical protein